MWPLLINQTAIVSPDNSDDLPLYKARELLTTALYVGIGGDLVAVFDGGATQLFTAVPSGVFLPLAVRRINATGTTADAIVACYVI